MIYVSRDAVLAVEPFTIRSEPRWYPSGVISRSKLQTSFKKEMVDVAPFSLLRVESEAILRECIGVSVIYSPW